MRRKAFVAVSLGPSGMKPTEAKKPTVGLVPAEDSSFAYRRARPGGGVTKQLPSGPPESASSFSSAFQAEGDEERAECCVAFVAVSLGSAGMKPTEA